MPVSVLVGERDSKFRAIAERMGFPTVVVEGAGHAVPLEAPAAVAGAPRGALNRWRDAEPEVASPDAPHQPYRAAWADRRHVVAEWRLPAPERRAARAERAVLRRLSLERDNVRHTPWARAAALEAERRRDGGSSPSCGTRRLLGVSWQFSDQSSRTRSAWSRC